MNLNSKIYIAGHQGLVGSALMRKLMSLGYTNLVTRTFAECDLRNQQAVTNFFESEKPEYVFLAAARFVERFATLRLVVLRAEAFFALLAAVFLTSFAMVSPFCK